MFLEGYYFVFVFQWYFMQLGNSIVVFAKFNKLID